MTLSRDQEPLTGRLLLEDGSVFQGEVFGHPLDSDGEIVFNTGMVGYVESLTDPSYRGQILTLTYPLVGNYGVPDPEKNPELFESKEIQVRGLIVSSHILDYSHWEAAMSLHSWLEQHQVVGLSGIDTRELTKHLREKGTMLGRIMVDQPGQDKPTGWEPVQDPNTTELVAQVSSTTPVNLPPLTASKETPPRIIVVDCGCKRSILWELRKRGCEVLLVPHDHDFTDIPCQGILLSSGPGDPAMCTTTIEHVARMLNKENPVPVAGICLGHQIIALAAGGKTFKLLYGHRSQNQPCQELGSQRCVISSQNHGYAVDPDSLSEEWKLWYTNLNDGTVEGIRHSSLPFFGVQFHPEASPGPTDPNSFFDEFMEVVLGE